MNPNEPLGLIGWRGIVPAKAGVMSGRLVNMVTTELISVDEILKVRVREEILKGHFHKQKLHTLTPSRARPRTGISLNTEYVLTTQ